MKNKKIQNKFSNMNKAVRMELREHKSSFMVYIVLRALVVTVLILQLINRNYENVFLCILTLLLLIIPSFLQVNLKIEFPKPLEIAMLLFIFAAEILGEIQEYYILFPIWDTMLHTINGFLAAAIGFALVDILNREEKAAFTLSPIYMSIVAFSVSMTIGVMWEFFEYGMDTYLGFDMQKDTILNSINTVMLDPMGGNKPVAIHNITSVMINGKELGLGGYLDIGLIDTMKDLFVNFIGAVVFAIIGFFYVKNRGKGTFAKIFIPRRKRKDADFLRIIEEESKIKVIVFDIGQVLVDFNYKQLINRLVLSEEKVEKVIKATVESEYWKELDRGVLTDEVILQLFIQEDASLETEIKLFFSNFSDILKERETTFPWIKKLKEKGYKVYYLSNFPKRMESECEKHIKFIEYMDGGILSYKEKIMKPDPAIYELLMERYHFKPEESVFIDDNDSNIKAAQELGMNGILFTTIEEVKVKLIELGVE